MGNTKPTLDIVASCRLSKVDHDWLALIAKQNRLLISDLLRSLILKEVKNARKQDFFYYNH